LEKLSKVREIKLKVAEAVPKDVNRGIARISSENMKRLGLAPGEAVEIIGKKSTAAAVWPGYPEDEALDIIRIDGTTRRNAEASLRDEVTVRKIIVKPAEKVVLAPQDSVRLSDDFENFVKRQLTGRIIALGDIITVPVLGMALTMTVVNTQPMKIVRIDGGTEVVITKEPVKGFVNVPKITYEDIGGMKRVLEKVREMIELPLKYPELFKHLGIEPPKGVLLYGPTGCGKTLLAKAVANEAGANFYFINGPEIMSKYYGESEEKLRRIFREAEENAPSIIFIDEIDAIASRREEATGEVEKRLVSQLLTLLDGLQQRGQVIVIAATNRPDALDPALRRPGRFDREISIGVPDKNGRKEILLIHSREMPLANDASIDELAELTHGYTGADLAALCREAAMSALRRVLPEIDLKSKKLPAEVLEKIKVERRDFMEALKDVQPSALREVYVEVPEVRWDDIGDLEEVKQQLKETVEWPLKYPDLFERLGVTPSKGVLLFGPPGTGKTMLAKAVATESGCNFIGVRGPEIMSKWVGESERAIRSIFQKARQTAPCIIFLDELDAIAARRGYRVGESGVTERIVNQLLSEMDGIVVLKNVVIIGATNRLDILDPALLRPGRFDKCVFVPPPDEEGRLAIFKVHTRRMPLGEDVELKRLAKLTEGYTGADIEAVCREAAMCAAREDIKAKSINMRHFMKALSIIMPSVSKEDMEKYEMMARIFKPHK